MSDTRLTVTFAAPSRMSREAIGAALARSRLRIIHTSFHAQGRPKLPDDLKQEALDLLSEGLSGRAVAKKLGISPMTVYGWRKEK